MSALLGLVTSAPRSATWTLLAGTRCLCLGRVSTKPQAGPDSVSLKQQADETRAFGLDLGRMHHFAEGQIELREDPGVSGLDEDRLVEIVTACQRAPQAAAAPGFVVVYDLSRFTRLGSETVFHYLYLLRKAGWQFRDTTLKLTGNPMTDAILIVVAAEVAAEHSRMLTRKVPPGLLKRAALGLGSGKPALGYRIHPTTGRLVPGAHSDVAKVRDIHDRVARGQSLVAVARATGLSPNAVRHVAGNPVYLGRIEHRSSVAYDAELLAAYGIPATVVTPTIDGGTLVTVEHAHEPLVDADTFARVERRLGPRHLPPETRRQRHPPGSRFVLSGLLTCAICGDRIVGGGTSGWTGAAFYRCPGRIRLPTRRRPVPPECGTPILMFNQARGETAVLDALARGWTQDRHKGVLAKVERELRRRAQATPTPGRRAQPGSELKRREIERKLALVDEAEQAELITADVATAQRATLGALLAALASREPSPDAAEQATKALRLVDLVRQLFTPKGFKAIVAAAPRALVRELLVGLIVGGTVERQPDGTIIITATTRTPAGLVSQSRSPWLGDYTHNG
jgi:DNA invertase Pin-like site-specific DNA recombinase